jgi:hypothetical protein
MNHLVNDVEYLERKKCIEELLLKQREADKKRLYFEKLPLETYPLSCSVYKTKAYTLQASIQKYKEVLLNTSLVSYEVCLDIISNIFGFENWLLFESTFQEYSKNKSNTEQTSLLCAQYKAKARSLQSALQREKDVLIKQDKIYYNWCLNIVSNIYGFENWQVVKSTFDEDPNKSYNENRIKFVEYKLQAFLHELKENEQFFNGEYLGDKEYFISDLTKLSKKISRLHQMLSDDRKILSKDAIFTIKFVKYCCYFYCSMYQSKIEEFVDELWESRNHDEINEFDPISFALEDLGKLKTIFERIRAPFAFISLLQSAQILQRNNQLEKNYQSFQQICKTISVAFYCLSILEIENPPLHKDDELQKRFNFDPALLNFSEIAAQYNLLQ